MTRLFGSFPLCFAIVLMTGCWGGSRSRNPQFVSDEVAQPTLVMGAVSCLGGEENAGGKVVTQRAGNGGAMIATLNDALARMAQTQPLPTFPSSVCADLLASASLDSDDWQHPVPPKAIAIMAKKTQARSVLVPVVSSTIKCSNEGVQVGSSYLESGTSHCKESSLTLAAFLFSDDGRLLWKSRAKLNIGNETPDLQGGVVTLFKDVPVRAVTRM